MVYKFLIILAQLRQMPAAVGSGKTAIEDQHHMLPVTKIRQPDGLAMNIRQGKIRGDGKWKLLRCVHAIIILYYQFIVNDLYNFAVKFVHQEVDGQNRRGF